MQFHGGSADQRETNMNPSEFAAYVSMCEEIVRKADGHWVPREKFIEALADCPEFWREPVRVMAQGGYYYSADEWMEKYVEPLCNKE